MHALDDLSLTVFIMPLLRLNKAEKEQVLQSAIRYYHDHKPAYSMAYVAKHFDVPVSTLKDRIKGVRPHVSAHQDQQKLSPGQELALEVHCKRMMKFGFPVRISALETIANSIIADPDAECEPRVGRTWHLSFLERHPDLSAKFCRQLDQARATASNPQIIQEFFAMYKSVVDKYAITPANIHNMDEKGFLIGQAAKCKVVVAKDRPMTKFSTQNGNRETVTVIESASATGKNTAPPMIICSGKSHMASWHSSPQSLPQPQREDGWHYAISNTGWTDAELATEWLAKCFEPHTRPLNASSWRLLLLDGHVSHVTADFIEYCWLHKIVPLCFPSHTTHLLQPLDVGVFSPLGFYYSKQIRKLGEEGINVINVETFMKIYPAIRQNAYKTPTMLSAFRATGLVPFNPVRVINLLPVRALTPEQTEQEVHLPLVPATPTNSKQATALHRQLISKLREDAVKHHVDEDYIEISPIKIGLDKLAKAATLFEAQSKIADHTAAQCRAANKYKGHNSKSKARLSKARVLSMDDVVEAKAKRAEKDKLITERAARAAERKARKDQQQALSQDNTE